MMKKLKLEWLQVGLFLALISCATESISNKNLKSAVESGDAARLRMLLKSENIPDQDKMTALLMTCRKGKTEIARELILNSTPVNGYKQISPLHIAAYWGNLEIVKLLVKSGADVNSRSDLFRATGFMGIGGTHEARLISNDLYWKKGFGSELSEAYVTPLHLAVMAGHTQIAKFLLENGANVNDAIMYRGAKGDLSKIGKCYILHIAVLTKSIDMCRLLIENGAEINPTDEYGHTPLDWATHYLKGNVREQLVSFLESKGANASGIKWQ